MKESLLNNSQLLLKYKVNQRQVNRTEVPNNKCSHLQTH